MEQKELLTQGGIYLAKLDPSKTTEVGKIRPVIVLNSQTILNSTPSIIFICPLSSQSQPEFNSLHILLTPRDGLKVISYTLVEHCRAISISRIVYPRIAQVTTEELNIIIHYLNRLIKPF